MVGAAVPSRGGQRTVLAPVAMSAQGQDSHAVSDLLAQAEAPALGDDTDEAHGEGGRGRVGAAQRQAGHQPHVPGPHQASLRRLGEEQRDSAGSGATEEGLISREGRNLRLPLRFGLWDWNEN